MYFTLLKNAGILTCLLLLMGCIVGRLLKDKGVVEVITSPSTRTRQTAEAIARGIGLTNPPDVDVAFSPLERGMTPDGESVSWSWREKQWQAGHDPRPQGGESLKDGMDRASLAIEELARRHPGKAVVIVENVMDITGEEAW